MNQDMTKQEIVKEVAKATGIESKAVLSVVEGFMEQVRNSLPTERMFTCADSVHSA